MVTGVPSASRATSSSGSSVRRWTRSSSTREVGDGDPAPSADVVLSGPLEPVA